MKKIKIILLLAAIAAISINLTLSTSEYIAEETVPTDDITLEQLMDELSSDEQQEPAFVPEVATEIIMEEPAENDTAFEQLMDELSSPLITESLIAEPLVIPTKNDIKTDLAHFNYKSAS